MFISESSTRAELEAAIVSEKALYGSFDETLLLNGGYTTAQLFEAITAWIEAGDECAAA